MKGPTKTNRNGCLIKMKKRQIENEVEYMQNKAHKANDASS